MCYRVLRRIVNIGPSRVGNLKIGKFVVAQEIQIRENGINIPIPVKSNECQEQDIHSRCRDAQGCARLDKVIGKESRGIISNISEVSSLREHTLSDIIELEKVNIDVSDSNSIEKLSRAGNPVVKKVNVINIKNKCKDLNLCLVQQYKPLGFLPITDCVLFILNSNLKCSKTSLYLG